MVVIAQVIITVQGRAQGVGYRAAYVQRARLLGLRGQVHNRRDGVVEAFLAGPEANVLSMQEWMWERPDSAQVTQLDVITGDHEAPAPGFETRSTVQFWAINGHGADTKRGQSMVPGRNENCVQPRWHCPHRSRW